LAWLHRGQRRVRVTRGVRAARDESPLGRLCRRAPLRTPLAAGAPHV